MAVFSAIFSFSNEAATTASLNATTSTADITIGKDRKFAIVATAAFNVKMGMAGQSAAAATDFEFPGAQVYTLATNSAADSIRIYNPGGTSLTYWLQPLCD
jgi:hypothetical protein